MSDLAGIIVVSLFIFTYLYDPPIEVREEGKITTYDVSLKGEKITVNSKVIIINDSIR